MSKARVNDPQTWQTLESSYVIDRPWLRVRQDRVRLPRGEVIDDYYVMEHPPWVDVIAVTPEQRVVLVRQYRHGVGEVHYELPGGVCDDGDGAPLRAAQRELLEETGFGGGHWREWMVLSANPARQSNVAHTFLAMGVKCLQPQKLETSEDITVHLVTLEETRQIVLGGDMLHALHAAPLLKLFLEGIESDRRKSR